MCIAFLMADMQNSLHMHPLQNRFVSGKLCNNSNSCIFFSLLLVMNLAYQPRPNYIYLSCPNNYVSYGEQFPHRPYGFLLPPLSNNTFPDTHLCFLLLPQLFSILKIIRRIIYLISSLCLLLNIPHRILSRIK